ncbi:hypothetical protein SAMN05421668_1267 [Halolactibacillus miurensis]|uniref:Uncharacterized protein n=1 Tax=Halolactibacillus miurensis TaxID=306541 RepID=A0A1I6UFU4_9BACI|nr:hypothetical protein SAMN05421668_1267 [Halolactibacillus miurensis]
MQVTSVSEVPTIEEDVIHHSINKQDALPE